MVCADVPSPIDLRLPEDARAWESAAMSKRPWRIEFFAAVLRELVAREPPLRRVLELGSGPGFLARYVLEHLGDVDYVALDFSAAMHQLAHARLGSLATSVRFEQRDFKDESWFVGLGEFDAVFTVQAIHELRHKLYATSLHRQVRSILSAGGSYLVCDHFLGEGGMRNPELYMSVEEQRLALVSAGFRQVREVLVKGGLVLHHAT
jgi:SAM-dependent methyltransferase